MQTATKCAMSMNLAQYDKRGYDPGGGPCKRGLWYVVNAVLFNSWLWPGSGLKVSILRRFGAKVGVGVVIKPRVNIKFPWHLTVGDYVWIGEGVWIDNLVKVAIGSNVCLSQEAYLLTGNHDYKDPAFGLVLGEIEIREGAWIGARAMVCPGVCVKESTVLTAGSVLRSDSEVAGVYSGMPAARVRRRVPV